MGRYDNVKQGMKDAAETVKEILFNWHPKERPAPPAPPADPHNPEDMKTWVDGVMKMIKEATANGSNLLNNDEAWKLHLVIEKFPPEYLEYYQGLQQEIAKIIPREEDRPTITLKIRGANRQDSKPFFGYVGGTGPLSDAATLLTVRDAYDYRKGDGAAAQDMAVDLISAPPPRGGIKLDHMRTYGWRVAKFAGDCGAPNIILLSNTAHIHLRKFKFVQQFRRAWKRDFDNIIKSIFEKSDSVIKNMRKAVIKNIQNGDPDGRFPRFDNNHDMILILGTEEGQKADLYGSKFSKRGMASKYPDKDGQQLQKLIDEIKSNNSNTFLADGKTVGEALVNFILDHYDSKVSHILLACTELPLCLHTKIPALLQQKYGLAQDATYQDIFDNQFKLRYPTAAVPIIIDTEQKFAEYSVNQIIENEEKLNHKPHTPTPDTKTTHGLICSSEEPELIEMPASVADKTAIPVPRSFYEIAHTFKELDSFADKGLIVYRPPEQQVTIDFTSQTASQKGEMAIAAIEAGLRLGVTQPIELSGEDFDAVQAGAQYCVSKGIGFYVADNMAPRLPRELQSGAPKIQDIPVTTAIMNIASLTGDNNPSPPAKRLRM